MIGDEHEAYIEIQCEYGRLAGGTLDEIKEYWESEKHSTGACKSRLVLADGTELEKRGIGSEGLRRQVQRRLAKELEADEDHDRELITEMAELLGMSVDEWVTS